MESYGSGSGSLQKPMLAHYKKHRGLVISHDSQDDDELRELKQFPNAHNDTMMWQDRMNDYLERKFDILQRGSTVTREIKAGIVLFCTCAYIFIMNPNILAIAQIDKNYTYVTTILVAVFGSALAGLACNLPLVIAPAMGLNTLMAVELVSTKGISVERALGSSFLTSAVLIILSQTGVIMKLVRITPTCLKKSIIVSLGLFQAVIGMSNLHLIQPSTASTSGVSTIGTELVNAETLTATFTVLSTMLLVAYGIEGSLLYGIIGGSIVARIVGAATTSATESASGALSWLVGACSYPSFGDLPGWIVIFTSALTMFLVTFIDAGGVMLALASQDVVLQDENGMMKHSQRVFLCVGLCGAFASLIGCSPPVILLESAAAITVGARTGLATLTATSLFLLCLLFRPFVDLVPASVGHAVLIIVGSFMMGAVTGITWDNITEAFPSYATIIATTFTCSLANGALTGFAVYSILNIPKWTAQYRRDASKTAGDETDSRPAFKSQQSLLLDDTLENLGRRISISDWTQMGLGSRNEIREKFRIRRTMSTPDSVV